MSQHVPVNNQNVPVNNQHVQSIIAKVCHTSYMVLLLLFLSTACVGVALHQQQLPANTYAKSSSSRRWWWWQVHVLTP